MSAEFFIDFYMQITNYIWKRKGSRIGEPTLKRMEIN